MFDLESREIKEDNHTYSAIKMNRGYSYQQLTSEKHLTFANLEMSAPVGLYTCCRRSILYYDKFKDLFEYVYVWYTLRTLGRA